MSIKYNTIEITPKYPNVGLTKVYHQTTVVWESFIPQTITFSAGSSLTQWTVPNGVTKLQVDCVASKGKDQSGHIGGYGGRVQCILSVIPVQILYFTVGAIPTANNTATYNASDIRTNNVGVTDTTSLNSRLVVAGGGGSSGTASATGGNGGAGGDLTGGDGEKSQGGKGGTQSAGGEGGKGHTTNATFGLGGAGGSTVGAGGAGWYGGGAGTGGGGGGSSYTHPTLCTQIPNVDIHTQGYQNGAGYITITTMNS